MRTPRPRLRLLIGRTAKAGPSELCGYLEQRLEVAEAARGAVLVLGLWFVGARGGGIQEGWKEGKRKGENGVNRLLEKGALYSCPCAWEATRSVFVSPFPSSCGALSPPRCFPARGSPRARPRRRRGTGRAAAPSPGASRRPPPPVGGWVGWVGSEKVSWGVGWGLVRESGWGSVGWVSDAKGHTSVL